MAACPDVAPALEAAKQRITALEAALAHRARLARHGRVLQHISVPAGAPAAHYSYLRLFLSNAGEAVRLTISEPYLAAPYQLNNLADLVDLLLRNTRVRQVHLTTSERSAARREALLALAAGFALWLTMAFVPGLHIREMVFDGGPTIVSDRGLDIYRRSRKAPFGVTSVTAVPLLSVPVVKAQSSDTTAARPKA